MRKAPTGAASRSRKTPAARSAADNQGQTTFFTLAGARGMEPTGRGGGGSARARGGNEAKGLEFPQRNRIRPWRKADPAARPGRQSDRAVPAGFKNVVCPCFYSRKRRWALKFSV